MDSLTSLPDLSLSVYRKAVDFCVLILYPTTLPNSLICYNSFLVVVVSSECYRYSIMSSASSNSFTSSFPIWIPFISFSSLIVMTRTSKTLLNNIDESGHPCLVPDLSGNVFSLSPLGIILAISFSYTVFYYVEVGSLCAYSLWRVFIRNGC